MPPAAPHAAAPAPLRVVPWLVAVAFFMEALDTTILNTAVPTLAAALHVAPLSMRSVLSSYTLSLAVFIPASGWAADRFGTRRVFASAIAIFSLGSLLCGLATNIHALVFFRVVQGLGGALMVPVGRLTMVRTFPKSQLVRAMAFVAIPALIGPMLGPVAGGAIVRFWSWRLVFFVNLPFGALGLALVLRKMPDYRTERVAPLDVVGLVLFGSGVALLSYVLEIFGEHSLGPTEMTGLLALSAALLYAYHRHSASNPFPLLRLDLFRARTLRIAIVGAFVTRIAVAGMPFLLPMLYQLGLGYSPLESGLLILPQSLAAMSLRLVMPRLLRRFGYRRVLLTNTAMIGVVIALYALVGPGTPTPAIACLSFVFGFFSSFQYTSMNTLTYADVSDADTSKASTLASAAQQMSMSFGVAAASLAAALFIPPRARGSVTGLVHGIHLAFLTLGALTASSALLFRGLTNTDGDNVSQHKIPEPEPV
ncbi:MAG TPA: DHA2 family efflux MFS transporter permease subunit [Polyangia bacterium]